MRTNVDTQISLKQLVIQHISTSNPKKTQKDINKNSGFPVSPSIFHIFSQVLPVFHAFPLGFSGSFPGISSFSIQAL